MHDALTNEDILSPRQRSLRTNLLHLLFRLKVLLPLTLGIRADLLWITGWQGARQ